MPKVIYIKNAVENKADFINESVRNHLGWKLLDITLFNAIQILQFDSIDIIDAPIKADDFIACHARDLAKVKRAYPTNPLWLVAFEEHYFDDGRAYMAFDEIIPL